MPKIKDLPALGTADATEQMVIEQADKTYRAGVKDYLGSIGITPARDILLSMALGDQQPNWFTAAQVNFADTSGNLAESGSHKLPVPDVYNNIPCWRLDCPANSIMDTVFSFSDLANLAAGEVISASVQPLFLTPSPDAGAGGGSSCTFDLIQLTATRASIAGGTTTGQLGDKAGLLVTPVNALSNVAKLANAAVLDFRLIIRNTGGTNARSLYFTLPFVGRGGIPTFRMPRKDPTLYLAGTSGHDKNSGALSAPLKSMTGALKAIGESGTIVIMESGDYRVPAAIAAASKASVKISVAPGVRARVLGGVRLDELGAITKTPGFSKVYQVSHALLHSQVILGPPYPSIVGHLNGVNILWQDGVPDLRTAISDTERHPLHRGRSYRLDHTRIMGQTAINTKTVGLAQIDGLTYPAFYADENGELPTSPAGVPTLYFTCSEGGDGSLANIYIPAQYNLFNAGNDRQEFELAGLQILYFTRNVQARGFRSVLLTDLYLCGARQENIQWSDTRYAELRDCIAVGSGIDNIGAHRYATDDRQVRHKMSGMWCAHSLDDAESVHEGCGGEAENFLYEYAGDRGVATSYGGRTVHRDGLIRKSGQWDLTTGEGFAAIEQPVGAPLPGDMGVATEAIGYNIIVEGARRSFGVQGSIGSKNRLTLYNCASIDPVDEGSAPIDATRPCCHLWVRGGTLSVPHGDLKFRGSAPQKVIASGTIDIGSQLGLIEV
ncbi:hypothetical protein [Sphingobium yanoikuyae]|uniref:Uncharacterized protein n=1 Tax=Sphingobium yanoikuyae TaxID=13690 RepID=A0A291N268_SPHYA|nr:hypothetical protein [Sphingobium yanoikuyae]ATI81457.1 hypothetical protein A6768_16640 [Sphingobium yanoikuyae]